MFDQLKNEVTLDGKAGGEPKMRMIGETKACSIRVATDSYGKPDADGKRTKYTEWHNVEARGKTAEYLEKHCKAGSRIILAGKLTYNSGFPLYDDNDNKVGTYPRAEILVRIIDVDNRLRDAKAEIEQLKEAA